MVSLGGVEILENGLAPPPRCGRLNPQILLRRLRRQPIVDISSILTEPMTTKLLAEYFVVNRNKMATMLKAMNGVEKCGGMWRVPVANMPPRYLVSCGLIPNSDRRCA